MRGDSDARPGVEDAPGRRHWFARPRWIALLIAGAALVAGAIPFAIAWSHRGAKEVSIAKAVEKFHESGGGTTAGFLRPAPGVYTFLGTGTEKLSLLATTQHWGPRIPVTVTEGSNGCWTFRVDFSTHHSQSVHYCARGRVLEQTDEVTIQSFDFVAFKAGDTNVTVCKPAIDRIRVDAEPGAQWHVACDGRSKSRGTKFHAGGTDTFVGTEKLEVGTEAVSTYHYSVDRTLTGSQSGRERYDIWYSVRDGLPIRVEREVEVKSPSPVGAVTYTEQGRYALASLTPRR